MRIFRLELKRVLKTRLTGILLLVSLFLSVLMAYLPTTFVEYGSKDAEGRWVEYHGMEAIRQIKMLREAVSGQVIPQTLGETVEIYQETLRKYDVETAYSLPEEAYYGRIFQYTPFMSKIREAAMNPNTGMIPGVLEVSPNQEGFYQQCVERLDALMKLEQKEYPSAQRFASKMYEKVAFPFTYYYGIDSDSIEYQILLIFIITIFCAIIAAPIFSSDYQTGADDILRCTKHGRFHLGIVKTLSSLLICGCAFVLCVAIYLLVCNSLFGWESTLTSMQIIFSVSSLPALNVGQLQITVAIGTLIIFLSIISFTLFLSSRLSSTVSSLALAILFCLLPMIATIALPENIGNWVRCLLPGGGIGLQNSLLYELIDFNFLHFGNTSVWMPVAIMVMAVLEIPIFLGLTVYSYCQKKN